MYKTSVPKRAKPHKPEDRSLLQYEWWVEWCKDPNPDTYWDRRWKAICKNGVPPEALDSRPKKTTTAKILDWYRKYRRRDEDD